MEQFVPKLVIWDCFVPNSLLQWNNLIQNSIIGNLGLACSKFPSVNGTICSINHNLGFGNLNNPSDLTFETKFVTMHVSVYQSAGITSYDLPFFGLWT